MNDECRIVHAARDAMSDGGSTSAWAPLASSPGAFTTFAGHLGVRTTSLHFEDVLGLDNDLLAMLPSPCIALVLTYPTSAVAQAHLDSKQSCDEARATHVGSEMLASATGPVFLRQRSGGACGTIAALHALINGARVLPASMESLLGRSLCEELLLLSDANGIDARGGNLCERRSQRLFDSPKIRAAHDLSATATATAASRAGERQGRHFVTFVRANDRLLICDGRRSGPIDCGPTCEATFLRDAADEVARLAAAVDAADALAFSLLALVANNYAGDVSEPE